MSDPVSIINGIKTRIAICIPSSRKDSMNKFLLEWAPILNSCDKYEITIFVHEDKPQPNAVYTIEASNIAIKQTSQLDVEDVLGNAGWIIPRGTSACRSFPMLLAWRAGFEYIFTLDDDCYPQESSFIEGHLSAFKLDRWFNTIEGDFARGVPYENRGQLPVRMNHGLWTEIPDLDGPTSLVRKRDPIKITLGSDHRVVPPGMFVPLCGMNICYHRSIIPAAYYLLMGLHEFGFDRFDDIWSGIIVKKILDHLGWYVTSGAPYIRHTKASNCFSNLRKEALGIHLNEYFWQHIMEAKIDASNVIECYKELSVWVQQFSDKKPDVPCPKGYFQKLGEAMITWADLFESKSRY
jgi:reversibly glycosylated polypeptide / UDP-arabinopyranose mutase